MIPAQKPANNAERDAVITAMLTQTLAAAGDQAGALAAAQLAQMSDALKASMYATARNLAIGATLQADSTLIGKKVKRGQLSLLPTPSGGLTSRFLGELDANGDCEIRGYLADGQVKVRVPIEIAVHADSLKGLI